ncbi:hypothetical protein [Alicyclobacillus dauci]|uniref:Uncharacterized protein n=1 Tax=Alicyclobacillus dauci TaxID=1475485 RepID=A0ABY6Z7Y4_9BACL|nr:hypothetical protein [Alicyclobacillus dauci]WAH39023.1 hypothetical protein NZD86_11335 [Alicyclobacillus dauci]
MIKRIPLKSDLALEVMWRQDRSLRVIVVAVFNDDKGYILDYYDTVREAKRAATHFYSCYRVAVEEGFTLIPGFFVHEGIGCGVNVAEGLAVEEPVEAFREVLRMLKAMRFQRSF